MLCPLLMMLLAGDVTRHHKKVRIHCIQVEPIFIFNTRGHCSYVLCLDYLQVQVLLFLAAVQVFLCLYVCVQGINGKKGTRGEAGRRGSSVRTHDKIQTPECTKQYIVVSVPSHETFLQRLLNYQLCKVLQMIILSEHSHYNISKTFQKRYIIMIQF